MFIRIELGFPSRGPKHGLGGGIPNHETVKVLTFIKVFPTKTLNIFRFSREC